jgi:hypothetical protein
MGVQLIQFLCLGCGLLLALPPAWCCWAPQLASAAQPESKRAPCCQNESAPKPTPAAPPAQCPCYDRNTTAPAAAEKVVADLSCAVQPVVAVVASPRAGPPAVAPPIPPPLSQPLHLLCCVWLC